MQNHVFYLYLRRANLELIQFWVPTGTKEHVMILSTTDSLENKRIDKYFGLVTGEAILGANIFKDIFGMVRDIVGGRAGAYENEMRKARELAMEEMKRQARALGANAVVGIDLDYEVIGGQGSNMMLVSVNGTAVLYSDR